MLRLVFILYLPGIFIVIVMETLENKHDMFYPHVSVDCVLLGTNDDKLCVLLVERQVAGSNEKHYKLPGSLIYESEDLDTAAYRVLNEATGLKRVALKQFRSFGSPARTKNKEDVQWLENASKMKISRIVTVAYLALCKVGKKMTMGEMSDTLIWAPVNELPHLPFDHQEIVEAAVGGCRTGYRFRISSIEVYGLSVAAHLRDHL